MESESNIFLSNSTPLVERIDKEELAKVYLSSVEGPRTRRRPLGRWEDRVKGYLSERGVRGNGLEQARRQSMERETWRFFCRGLGDAFGGSKASELLTD